MANLPEEDTWEDTLPPLLATDDVAADGATEGDMLGAANRLPRKLASRTRWLYNRLGPIRNMVDVSSLRARVRHAALVLLESPSVTITAPGATRPSVEVTTRSADALTPGSVQLDVPITGRVGESGVGGTPYSVHGVAEVPISRATEPQQSLPDPTGHWWAATWRLTDPHGKYLQNAAYGPQTRGMKIPDAGPEPWRVTVVNETEAVIVWRHDVAGAIVARQAPGETLLFLRTATDWRMLGRAGVVGVAADLFASTSVVTTATTSWTDLASLSIGMVCPGDELVIDAALRATNGGRHRIQVSDASGQVAASTEFTTPSTDQVFALPFRWRFTSSSNVQLRLQSRVVNTGDPAVSVPWRTVRWELRR